MKVALRNVRIFDGEKLSEPTTISIENGIISSEPSEGDFIDGKGGVLMPGLIDSHVHLHTPYNLEEFCKYGVTTALDMGNLPLPILSFSRRHKNITQLLTCGPSATAPGSTHSHMPGFPKAGMISNPLQAERYVKDRVAQGVDYIKMIADVPGGPDQDTLNSLALTAREYDKTSIAHASSAASFAMAQQAGVDVVTHAPLNTPLDEDAVNKMVREKRISVPTLAMMESISLNKKRFPRAKYENARESVRAMYNAGVPILAGTDANNVSISPARVPHGIGLHHELELLVEAGLSTVDALRAATVLNARYFGLHDRGEIKPGFRADLVLVDGNPLEDIRATRNIQRVWCNGVEYVPSSGSWDLTICNVHCILSLLSAIFWWALGM